MSKIEENGFSLFITKKQKILKKKKEKNLKK